MECASILSIYYSSIKSSSADTWGCKSFNIIVYWWHKFNIQALHICIIVSISIKRFDIFVLYLCSLHLDEAVKGNNNKKQQDVCTYCVKIWLFYCKRDCEVWFFLLVNSDECAKQSFYHFIFSVDQNYYQPRICKYALFCRMEHLSTQFIIMVTQLFIWFIHFQSQVTSFAGENKKKTGTLVMSWSVIIWVFNYICLLHQFVCTSFGLFVFIIHSYLHYDNPCSYYLFYNTFASESNKSLFQPKKQCWRYQKFLLYSLIN